MNNRGAAASRRASPIPRGDLSDTDSLDYLCDTVGLIMGLLDIGGAVAVFDPFRLDWWAPDEWRAKIFGAHGPVPRHHVVILISDDEHPGRYWVHTRGMQKFGRPDLSIRGLTRDKLPAIEDLCNRFIELQAFGAGIPEGKPIRMNALAGDWRCYHEGHSDDPDFNNVHVEIRRVD